MRSYNLVFEIYLKFIIFYFYFIVFLEGGMGGFKVKIIFFRILLFKMLLVDEIESFWLFFWVIMYKYWLLLVFVFDLFMIIRVGFCNLGILFLLDCKGSLVVLGKLIVIGVLVLIIGC